MLWLAVFAIVGWRLSASVGSQSPKPGYKTERASEIAVLRNVDDGCGAYKTVRFVCVRLLASSRSGFRYGSAKTCQPAESTS
jgi:hypothetical protein